MSRIFGAGARRATILTALTCVVRLRPQPRDSRHLRAASAAAATQLSSPALARCECNELNYQNFCCRCSVVTIALRQTDRQSSERASASEPHCARLPSGARDAPSGEAGAERARAQPNGSGAQVSKRASERARGQVMRVARLAPSCVAALSSAPNCARLGSNEFQVCSTARRPADNHIAQMTAHSS